MISRAHARLAAASLGPIGHLRPASGTWGSLPPVLVCAGLLALGVTPASPLWPAACALMAVGFSIACLAGADAAEARWGTDPSPVVADEAAGQSITLAALFLPTFFFPSFASTPGMFASAPAWLWPVAALLAAFLLFRIADILKPWPANSLQNVPGGWGILLDDLAAGVQAGVVVAAGVVGLRLIP
jgi:phosphatidylglycerophosphatase A